MHRYRNQTGVEIRAVDFGGLGGIDALDPGLPSLTPLYSGLTKAFKDEGYEERKDLFGAPYDFRLAGDGLKQVLQGLLIHGGVTCPPPGAWHFGFGSLNHKAGQSGIMRHCHIMLTRTVRENCRAYRPSGSHWNPLQVKDIVQHTALQCRVY